MVRLGRPPRGLRRVQRRLRRRTRSDPRAPRRRTTLGRSTAHHAERPLHRSGGRPADVDRRCGPRLRRRTGARTRMRLGKLPRLRASRLRPCRRRSRPHHRPDRAGPLRSDGHDSRRALRTRSAGRPVVRPLYRQRAIRQGDAPRPAPQPWTPRAPQLLPAQEPAPRPTRRHGRCHHVEVHARRPEPRGSARDGRSRRPGGCRALPGRRVPSVRRNQCRLRPPHPPTPIERRAGPQRSMVNVDTGRSRRSRADPRERVLRRQP